MQVSRIATAHKLIYGNNGGHKRFLHNNIINKRNNKYRTLHNNILQKELKWQLSN